MKKIIATLFCMFLVTVASAQDATITAPQHPAAQEHNHKEGDKEKPACCKKDKKACCKKDGDKAACEHKEGEKECKKKCKKVCKKKCKKDKTNTDSTKVVK